MSNYDISLLKNNIKTMLHARNMTQAALSEKTGIAQARISKILSDRTSDSFTVPQLVSISEALEINVDTLLFGKRNKIKETLSVQDVCSMLVQIDEAVPFCISLKEFEETAAYPEKDDDTGEYGGQIGYRKFNIQHPQIFFLEHETSDELGANDFYWVELQNTSQKRECWEINRFLEKYLKIREIRNQQLIDQNTFYDVIKSYITDLDTHIIPDRRNPDSDQNKSEEDLLFDLAEERRILCEQLRAIDKQIETHSHAKN